MMRRANEPPIRNGNTIISLDEGPVRLYTSSRRRNTRHASRIDYAGPSPFDRLPVELHAEIFSHCLAPFPQIGSDEPPVLISRVCAAWRALALATPKLWSSFEIEVQEIEDSNSDMRHTVHILSVVSLWLERSKSHPLSVRLIHVPTGRMPGNLSVQLLAMLVLQARRWRHVEFIVPSSSLSAVQHLLPEDFPALKSLTLHMKGLWNSAAFDIHAMKVPWSQLTEVDLRLDHNHLLNLDDYLDILSDAANLTSCTANANCVLTRQGSERDRLALPALKTLRLILQGGIPNPPPSSLRPEASLVSFLGLLADCSLSVLRIDWRVDSGDGIERFSASQAGFVSFLEAQAPTLRTLKLAYLALREEEVGQCLAQLPHLEELGLRFSLADQIQDPITDDFLRSLASAPPPVPCSEGKGRSQYQQEAPGLLPELERLSIQCSGERCSHDALLNLIQSRVRPSVHGLQTSASALKMFRFCSLVQVLDDPPRHIKEWAAAGMDVAVESAVIL